MKHVALISKTLKNHFRQKLQLLRFVVGRQYTLYMNPISLCNVTQVFPPVYIKCLFYQSISERLLRLIPKESCINISSDTLGGTSGMVCSKVLNVTFSPIPLNLIK